MSRFSKIAGILGVMALSVFLAVGTCTSFARAEEEKSDTAKELELIDGGDAEYWKYYDAEGNPISAQTQEGEESPRRRAIDPESISIRSPYTEMNYVLPLGYEITSAVDVSKFQTGIDWKRVKNAGIDSVIIRCGNRGYGEKGTLVEDDKFDEHIKGALAAGLRVGAYIYSQAITEEEAKEEAALCMKKCGPYLEQMDLPIIMDVEYADIDGSNGGRLYHAKLSVTRQTALCRAFCQYIEECGYRAMVYANKSFLISQMDPAALISEGSNVWLAHYTTGTDYKKTSFLIWQYSEDGKVTGITDISGSTIKVDTDFILEKDVQTAPVWKAAELSSKADYIRLQWKNAENFPRGYVLERRVDGGAWEEIKTIEAGAACEYRDTQIAEGHRYEYRIRTYYTKNGETRYSLWSGTASAAYPAKEPAVPVLKKAEAVDYHTIRVSWNAVENAQGYRVYRKTAQTSWERIADNYTGTSYTDSKAVLGTEYIYTVRAYRIVNGEKILSGYVKAGIKGASALNTPVLSSASATDYNKIQVKWKAVDGAQGYRVYRKTAQTSWERIADNYTGTSYTDSKAVLGTEYIYTVRAYRIVNGEKILSGYVKAGIKGASALNTPVLSSTSATDYNKIQVKWNAVNGAQGYRVYRKTAQTSWERIADNYTGTSYTDSKAVLGTEYIYTVRAYRIMNGEKILSGYVKAGIKGTSALKTPELWKTNIVNGNKIGVFWKAVNGAQGYRVYRKTPGGSWERIKDNYTGTSYTDSNVKPGTIYIYTIRAYRTVNNVKILSGYNKNGIRGYIP